MGIKDLLYKKNKNVGIEETEEIKRPNLNEKVDEYVNWYYKNIIIPGSHYYRFPISCHIPRTAEQIKDLIEKIAVWYELRYPKYEVARLFSGKNYYRNYSDPADNPTYAMELKQNDYYKKIDYVMFNNNNYINKIFDREADIRLLDWKEFYNANAFIHSLPSEERWALMKPKHDVVSLYDGLDSIELNKEGIIIYEYGISFPFNCNIGPKNILGKRFDELIELYNKENIEIPEFIKKYKDFYDARTIAREGLFECVMYRIIDRGSTKIGPRRALLFAKEFKCNIDIPMMYGVDTHDYDLGIFIDEYLKAGGKEDLECYNDYFGYLWNNKTTVGKIKLNDSSIRNNRRSAFSYTDERKELYQRLLNAMYGEVDQDLLKTETVKKLRIERKLNNKH